MNIEHIEINFPRKVTLTSEHQILLSKLASKICDANKKENKVMWPSGQGFKMTYMPLTQEEEKHRGCEFDEDCFAIDCVERLKHSGE